MKILQKYIIRQALVTLAMTVGVFTFVLLLGGMMKQMGDFLVNRQVGLQAVGMFLVLVTPYFLSFSLPMSMLATALLVFGRLSADNEINAMRASGVSLWQVAAPVLVLAALMSGLCLYINSTLAPACRFQFRTLFVRLGMERPMALLEEGTLIDHFPGVRVFIGRKRERDNLIENVIIQVLDDRGIPISRLEAKRGVVSVRPETTTLLLDLREVRGDLRDPNDPTNIHKIRAGTTAQRYPMELDLGRVLRRPKSAKKIGDLTLGELWEEIANLRAQGIYPAAALMESHRRVAAAVACVSFTLIGIPLGLKTSRRETSIGIAISLGLALAYYFVIIAANTLKDRPHLFPEAILWSPNLIFEVVGLWLLWRVTRA